ncbi:type VI secretion protein [Lonsdalea britannica]|uniref:Type VI secretion system-associated protein TagO n=1 Tax=Lonsdalea britannica TaxID=1082704 RepID=A0AAD0WKF1_9GAMM|nr:type VI secretion system-associated protein VasI [Lonsdalea britannica]AXW86794.1 type VI secretion system-associated protein TagO [Lonsdalea britannica]OSM95111.1 type VI secretion protein [Lonsdalea britannica]OSN04429.1 type VI secretion protein [Lonsdalea britannica]
MSILSLLPLLVSATTAPDPHWERLLQQCSQETVPQVRLACYDAIGRTSAPSSGASERPAADWHTLGANNAGRDGFVLNRDEASDSQTLTRRAVEGGTLTISCSSAITHLRLQLDNAWPGEQIQARIDGEPTADNWFVRNRGMLLEFGRGLPAIEELKRWIGHRELLLSDDRGRTVQVDLSGLGDALKPLRQQCRW